jgi:ribonuclease-3
MLEDALEALFGAVYLDGGLEAARQTIDCFLGQQIESQPLSTSSQNPKGRLQEWSQKHRAGEVPVYLELPAEGPDHERTYRAAVKIGEEILGRGDGSSKKSAEAQAAETALKSIIHSSSQS